MTTATREKPIPFRREMREAIEAGRKTQTRRVVKWSNSSASGTRYKRLWAQLDFTSDHVFADGRSGDDWYLHVPTFDRDSTHRVRSTIEPGDILWVKEGRFTRKADSRLRLEVTAVRVERVQSISARDITAEGAVDRPHDASNIGLGKCPVSAFDGVCYMDLMSLWAAGWNRIHGPGAWERNDWVWVYTFRRITP